jgi:hypothetical protein
MANKASFVVKNIWLKNIQYSQKGCPKVTINE